MVCVGICFAEAVINHASELWKSGNTENDSSHKKLLGKGGGDFWPNLMISVLLSCEKYVLSSNGEPDTR